MSRADEPWDIAVVGAGPAGSVCAASALAASNRLRVALIDRDAFPRDKACGDAVRSDAADVLRELGLDAVFDGRPLLHNIELTVPEAFAALKAAMKGGIIRGPDGERLGYHVVERRVFDGFLFEQAVRRGAADWTGHTFVDAEFDESAGLWTLKLRHSSGAAVDLRSKALVGADGAGSRVRRVVGVAPNGKGHVTVALRAYAQAEGLPEGTLRFDLLMSLIPGYGWTFPLAGDRVNIGVMMDSRDYQAQERPLESYLDEYVQYLRDEGVIIRNLGGVRTHPLPLASQSLPLAPGRRAALIGDAAAMISPMTGEGIYFGIWAARALGSGVGRRLSEGGELQGAFEAWARAYEAKFGAHMKAHNDARNWTRLKRVFQTGPARSTAPPPPATAAANG